MERFVLALVIVAVVVPVAAVVRRRRTADAPSRGEGYRAPVQLDRADFARPDAPWLVVVFSSATCDACASMVAKSAVLESPAVAVQEVEYVAHRALHDRYAIAAVPTTVVVDAQGVVRTSFLGPISATDLWAAVAEAREPGTTPRRWEQHDPADHDHDRDV